jgi:hypothetical protein
VLGAQFLDHRRGLELVGGAVVIAMGVDAEDPRWPPAPEAAPAAAGRWEQPSPAPPSASLDAHRRAAGGHRDCRQPAGLRTVPCCCSSTAWGGRPFLAAGIWLPSVMSATRVLRDHWTVVTRVSGAVLIVAGVLLASGRLTDISTRLAG